MKTIAVGSQNPIKIEAVQKAFEQVFPDEAFEVSGYAAASDVSDQPMGSDVTLQGARNRVRNTRELAPDSDFYVGLEGGLEDLEGELIEAGWMVIEDQAGKEGVARTASLTLPQEVSDIILNKGKEMGDAVDEVFQKENSKQKTGLVGIVTDGLIMRSDYYVHTLILALVKFKN